MAAQVRNKPMHICRSASVLLSIALLLTSAVSLLSAQELQSCSSNKAQDNLVELLRFAHTVGSGEEDVTQLFERLERTTKTTRITAQGYRLTVGVDNLTRFLEGNYPNKYLSAKLFSTELIGSWLGAMQSGDDCYPPMDEIYSAWKAWVQKHKDLVQALSQAADLENQKEDVIAKNGVPVGKEVEMLSEQVDDNLARARADLDFSIDFPEPIEPSDRSASPFAGTVNRGAPDRISIWTDRSSAPLGSTIQTAVGLANKNGPNSIADKNYSISLHCDGCVVNINSNESSSNTTVNIEKGLGSTTTSIRVQKPRVSISATAKGLKPAIVNAYGCEEGQDLHLATDETQSSGFASGPPIPLNLILEDSNNLPATNNVDKIVRFGATGGATVRLRYLESGSIVASNYRNGDPIRLPGSECVLKLDVRSPIVGHVSAPAFYRDKSSIPNPEFDFYYALRASDYIAGVIGVLLGFATKDAFWEKRKVRWLRAFLTCLAGGSLIFALAYLKVVKNQTHPWMVFGACSLAGSILGLATAKIFLLNVAETITGAQRSREDTLAENKGGSLSISNAIVARLGQIAGLAGIALGVLLVVFRATLVKDFLPKGGLNTDQAYHIMFAVLLFTFGIASVGILAWIIGKSVKGPVPTSLVLILAAMTICIVVGAVFIASRTAAQTTGDAGGHSESQTPPAPAFHDADREGNKYVVNWDSDPNCSNFDHAPNHRCNFTHTQMKFAGDNTPYDHWDLKFEAPGPVTSVVCQPTGSNEFNQVKGDTKGEIDGHWATCQGWINGGDAPIHMTAYYQQTW